MILKQALWSFLPLRCISTNCTWVMYDKKDKMQIIFPSEVSAFKGLIRCSKNNLVAKSQIQKMHFQERKCMSQFKNDNKSLICKLPLIDEIVASRFWCQYIHRYPYMNSLRPEQNGCHFQTYFLQWKGLDCIKILLKLVPQGPNDKLALVQEMAWCLKELIQTWMCD